MIEAGHASQGGGGKEGWEENSRDSGMYPFDFNGGKQEMTWKLLKQKRIPLYIIMSHRFQFIIIIIICFK